MKPWETTISKIKLKILKGSKVRLILRILKLQKKK